MTSTELKIGLTSSARPSSRVLKPPGGGHSNIFAEPEVSVNAPRPKYNQQNSSNLNACMGSTDPNKVVEKMREELVAPPKEDAAEGVTNAGKHHSQIQAGAGKPNGNSNDVAAQRGRVPPGGYSSGGFW